MCCEFLTTPRHTWAGGRACPKCGFLPLVAAGASLGALGRAGEAEGSSAQWRVNARDRDPRAQDAEVSSRRAMKSAQDAGELATLRPRQETQVSWGTWPRARGMRRQVAARFTLKRRRCANSRRIIAEEAGTCGRTSRSLGRHFTGALALTRREPTSSRTGSGLLPLHTHPTWSQVTHHANRSAPRDYSRTFWILVTRLTPCRAGPARP